MGQTEKPKQLDIAHVFFLELLRDHKNNLGAPLAARQMNNRASLFARNLPRQDFENWDQFTEALRRGETLFGLWEPLLEMTGMIIVSPECPFGAAVESYLDIMGGLPNEYYEVTDEFNRTSPLNQQKRIGQGSACGPFCAIHQPLRAIAGSKTRIGGKKIQVTSLGSKLEKEMMLAFEYLAEEKIAPDDVRKILEKNSCCFLIRLVDAEDELAAGGEAHGAAKE